MTIDELRNSGKQVAFGEGDAKHGYARADNWEPAATKLRHAFWGAATLEPANDHPGVVLATMPAVEGSKKQKPPRVLFVQ